MSLLSLLKRLFCSHKWEKVSEKTLPSAYEQVIESGQVIKNMRGASSASEIFGKVHVVILKCDRCGSVKTVRTRN